MPGPLRLFGSPYSKMSLRPVGRNKQMTRGMLQDLCFTGKVIFLEAEMI